MNIYELDDESVNALRLVAESNPNLDCPIHKASGTCDKCTLKPVMDKFELLPCDVVAIVIIKLRELNR